jgi:hypothetical protein
MISFSKFLKEVGGAGEWGTDKLIKKYKKDTPGEGKLDKKTYEPDKLAKMHKVHQKHIENELKMGVEIEKEHTSDEKTAREIALDHLKERPDYYTRLKTVEKH